MARNRPHSADQPCPCGYGPPYAECCGRWHGSTDPAPTAELLMRSRYSAFALGDAAYLLRTWHPRTRPRRLDLSDSPRYTRLEVLETTGGSMFETEGRVRFAAHYVDGGQPGVLREHSTFVREHGHWLYVGPL
ncbi:YchJ family protein [Catellatospora sp. KI3]|uniref:YchJ family protein n=1 Tax=Catellatospora sp. KI3 TaxID=3041620 RepID=UPI002482A340|nr:YchJ family protein [Catellatospora sp. KI3]MDI1465838.1 YchJ family protein [Catellatospora sp. KI3]